MRFLKGVTHVFAGRLQVLHNGHKAVTQAMLDHAKDKPTVILQVDLPPNDLNPHSPQQINEMFKIVFPKEIESKRLQVIPLSSLNWGGLKSEELWTNISGGNPASSHVFFGKKSSADDQVGNQHYMEFLAEKFGFNPHPITPVRSQLNGKEEISASNMLRNPYHKGLVDCVSPGILKYMAQIWQTAYDEGCKISEVVTARPGAYEDFLKNFQQKNSKLLVVNRYGEVESVPAEIFYKKVMKQDNMPDRSISVSAAEKITNASKTPDQSRN